MILDDFIKTNKQTKHSYKVKSMFLTLDRASVLCNSNTICRDLKHDNISHDYTTTPLLLL